MKGQEPKRSTVTRANESRPVGWIFRGMFVYLFLSYMSWGCFTLKQRMTIKHPYRAKFLRWTAKVARSNSLSTLQISVTNNLMFTLTETDDLGIIILKTRYAFGIRVNGPVQAGGWVDGYRLGTGTKFCLSKYIYIFFFSGIWRGTMQLWWPWQLRSEVKICHCSKSGCVCDNYKLRSKSYQRTLLD